jgi:hypothetical protein
MNTPHKHRLFRQLHREQAFRFALISLLPYHLSKKCLSTKWERILYPFCENKSVLQVNVAIDAWSFVPDIHEWFILCTASRAFQHTCPCSTASLLCDNLRVFDRLSSSTILYNLLTPAFIFLSKSERDSTWYQSTFRAKNLILFQLLEK